MIEQEQYCLLQEFITPGEHVGGPVENYFHVEQGDVVVDGQQVTLAPGTTFNTLTFYNALSTGKWQKYTGVTDIGFQVEGTGNLTLELSLATIPEPPAGLPRLNAPLTTWPVNEEILSRRDVFLTENKKAVLDPIKLPHTTCGLLFVRIHAQQEVRLTSAGFVTTTAPINAVKLGIVITHFNRQSAVNAAAARIQTQLLNAAETKGKAKLYIVDNSRNCGIDDTEHLKVIPNNNYGGSGGFSRGLLELVMGDEFTHCLFMDDDATCEIESIRRIITVFSYANDDRIAVAGSLVQASNACTIYEAGAYFNGLCHRIHRGLDTRLPLHILLAEREVFASNYGGWWFFGFALKDVTSFPFPFFVRGDDVAFSITNQFNIVTINGIAAYGDTFESKHSALTTYLDTRGHLVQQIAVLKQGRLKVLKGLCRFFLMSLLSYRYGSSAASLLAVKDVMQGPDFFEENIDMARRFPLLSAMSQDDRGIALNEPPQDIVVSQRFSDSFFRKLLRVITVNGLLIPSCLLENTPVFQHPGFKAHLKQVFGYRKIYYSNSPNSAGELVSLDKSEATRLFLEFIRAFLSLAFNFGRIKKQYEQKFPRFSSKEFWEKKYCNGGTRH